MLIQVKHIRAVCTSIFNGIIEERTSSSPVVKYTPSCRREGIFGPYQAVVERECLYHTKLSPKGDASFTKAAVERGFLFHTRLSSRSFVGYPELSPRPVVGYTPSCRREGMPLSHQAVVERGCLYHTRLSGCLIHTKLSSRGDVCPIPGCRRGWLLDTHEAVVDGEEFIGGISRGCISRGHLFVSPVRQPSSVIPSVKILQADGALTLTLTLCWNNRPAKPNS